MLGKWITRAHRLWVLLLVTLLIHGVLIRHVLLRIECLRILECLLTIKLALLLLAHKLILLGWDKFLISLREVNIFIRVKLFGWHIRHLFLMVALLFASVIVSVKFMIVSVILVVCLIVALVFEMRSLIIIPFAVAKLMVLFEIVVFLVFVVVLLLIL